MAGTRVRGERAWRQGLGRYLLTGAGIGLYFGYFFRPVRETSLFAPVILGAIAALVMVAIKRPGWSNAPGLAASTFVKFTFIFAILEARHLAYDWGGKLPTIIMTTAMGLLTGLWFAYESCRTRP